MHIIIISNYKKKLVILSLVITLWVVMFMASNLFLDRSLLLNITINDYLTFSYPHDFEVKNIYVSDQVQNNAIQVSHALKKPSEQKFSSYNSLKGNFSFSYPSAFELNEQVFSGSEILYHIDFRDNSSPSHGFIQVWNMPYPLSEFLNNSKASSKLTYKDFKTYEKTIDDVKGYYWDYAVLGGNGTYYKGSEVFFKKSGLMYRISYFVPEDQWTDTQEKIFWNMVKSFKTY